MNWALDTNHADLFHRFAYIEKSVIVHDGIESTLTPLMEALESEFPGIRVFSLPSVGDGTRRRHIELGVKGEPELVDRAYAHMLTGLDLLKQEYSSS
jgi:molybdopterin-biosynthesis enzyme MoeA-like protein